MKLLLINILFFLCIPVFSQSVMLRDTVFLNMLKTGSYSIYNMEFEKAEEIYQIIKNRHPHHPSIPFYQGMLYYWKYYPLVPGGKGSDTFTGCMDSTLSICESILKEEENNIDATFFHVAAQSFMAMYYADNGKSSRAILYLKNFYHLIMKSFELQDQFKEFWFFTGLYNYYIEAYPEAHPVYKSIKVFLKSGDKELGLETLKDAAYKTVFMRAEAYQFLTIIYLGYENDPAVALKYAALLNSEFPGNSSFISRYAELLLLNRHYEEANPIIEQLFHMDKFSSMSAFIYRGIFEELKNHDIEKAKYFYTLAIELAEPFGIFADYQLSYAYIGLSRYYRSKGEMNKARDYYKQAKDANPYPYIYENY